MKLYDNPLSGNCYKLRLLFSQLEIPFERVDVSVLGDRDRAADRVELSRYNPNSRVPTLELDDGSGLWESNAILCHFAEGTTLYPADRDARTNTLAWLFFEQSQVLPNIGTARYWLSIVGDTDGREAEIRSRQALGRRALGVLDTHLTDRRFVIGEAYSIADIALFAYTHIAADAGIDQAKFPGLDRWFDVVREQPGFVPML